MQIAQKNFYKKLLGRVGEKKACAFLKDNGYKILETNYRTPFGEIDIIVEIDKITVFVEVKTRSNENYGFPCEAVDNRKQEKYYKIATYYFCRTIKITNSSTILSSVSSKIRANNV